MKPKVIRYNEKQAADAFAVHAALLKCERDDPTLSDNAHWTMLRQDAFERFSNAFEARQ